MNNLLPLTTVVTLYSAGSMPGIPGTYAPGVYIADYAERTMVLIPNPGDLPDNGPEDILAPLDPVQSDQD